jgi:hypothetical protein
MKPIPYTSVHLKKEKFLAAFVGLKIFRAKSWPGIDA